MHLRVVVPAILLAAGAVAAVVALLLAPASTTRRPRASSTRGELVPQGFIGSMLDGPAVSGGAVNVDQQLDAMLSSGVESLRISVDWATAQPYPSFAAVPADQRGGFEDAGGVPTRFAALDRIVGPAAVRGMSVLPVVAYTPRWDALRPGDPASAPRSPAPYAEFLVALVRRYGPHGTFWATHPRIPAEPIRMWQIWNEPDFASYWSEQPFAPSYVRLLAASRPALRAADPEAKLVLAGLPDFSWEYLAQIYRVPGAARLFDVVAIHPYTAHAQGVPEILGRVRAVMDQFGDAGKPILATEVSWPSSQGRAPQQFGIGTSEALQAERLAQVMPLLAADRVKLGLIGFYWYTWMGDESPGRPPYAFDYAGLLKYVNGRITAKPALAAFKHQALAIEGCRRKGKVAGSCL